MGGRLNPLWLRTLGWITVGGHDRRRHRHVRELEK